MLINEKAAGPFYEDAYFGHRFTDQGHPFSVAMGNAVRWWGRLSESWAIGRRRLASHKHKSDFVRTQVSALALRTQTKLQRRAKSSIPGCVNERYCKVV